MFWADKIATDTQDYQVVNDSKTPSGRVHVGSLRGVVIHDVIYKALKHAHKPVKFIYGVDDYDALDTVPGYLDRAKFSPYLGFPLCNVPAPEGESDFAKHFMGEFLEVFAKLGISPEVYYLRDLYRMGQLDRYIDLFLQNAHLVRESYLEISKSKRADNWYPFQPICEKCGKIATTVVTDYNGKEVFYTCEPTATNYVQGCGHSGWVSPFGGNGKLPWKVEWVAKWDLLGVTIEMAGKDHSQKGGSRDVANSICRKVLKKQPPFHSPYEFILVNGSKMSSSKGVGSGAKEIAEFLPPELLRFLMLRTQPRTVINFETNYETITRLLRDYDTLIEKFKSSNDSETEELMPLAYAQLDEEIQPYQVFDFSTLISLLQIPHLDIEAEVEKRSATTLSDRDWQVIRERITVAQKWLQDYADEDEKLVLYLDKLPERTNEITPEQFTYLAKLQENLGAIADWEGEALQTCLFATAKELEIQQKDAFKAVYLSFLGKERGPKAGYLLSYLDRPFVISRLQEVVALNLASLS
jgi:lysyl-tRNA synthetase, class I